MTVHLKEWNSLRALTHSGEQYTVETWWKRKDDDNRLLGPLIIEI